MRRWIGTVGHRPHQPRQFRQVRPRPADGELDNLIDTERTRDDSPRADPRRTAIRIESGPGQRDALPQEAVFAELRERLDDSLGARRVTGGPEEDVEGLLAQKPTRSSCEA